MGFRPFVELQLRGSSHLIGGHILGLPLGPAPLLTCEETGKDRNCQGSESESQRRLDSTKRI